MSISLQTCTVCGTIQYPRRAVCQRCLASVFEEQVDSGAGILAAIATVHRSLEAQFAPILPAVIGKAMLDCGVHIVCFVEGACAPGERIILTAEPAENGTSVFRARPAP